MKYQENTYNGKCDACKELKRTSKVSELHPCPFCIKNKEHKRNCKCNDCKQEIMQEENKPKPLFIALTDTHLSPDTEETVRNIFIEVIQKAKELGLKRVFHGGDIFDSRKAQPQSTLDCFGDILELFKEEDMQLVAIAGNHDKNDYESERSYLDAFRYHPNFKLIRDWEIDGLNENFHICLIPFFKESTSYLPYLEELKKKINPKKKTILLTHIAINGVKNNDGSLVENNLTKDLFSCFYRVFVGHYHNTSVIDNIVYFGSSHQHNFGEDERKGFLVFYEDGGYSQIRSTFPKFQETIIDLNETSLIEIDQLLQEFKDNKNNIRFTFKGTLEQVKSIDENKFKRLGIDVKKKSSEIEVGIQEANENAYVSFDKVSIYQEFREFCELNEINDKEIGLQYMDKNFNEKGIKN